VTLDRILSLLTHKIRTASRSVPAVLALSRYRSGRRMATSATSRIIRGGSTMRIEVYATVDRSITDAFHWYADDHVRNHPRWDPDMELEQISEGAIGVGTVIRRRNTHFETPIEGTMEVVEYEPHQAFGVVIRDGPQETRGRVTFKEEEPHRTTIAISAEFQGIEESKRAPITNMMERTARNIKELIETDV
jgi:hypothetical protein